MPDATVQPLGDPMSIICGLTAAEATQGKEHGKEHIANKLSWLHNTYDTVMIDTAYMPLSNEVKIQQFQPILENSRELESLEDLDGYAGLDSPG